MKKPVTGNGKLPQSPAHQVAEEPLRHRIFAQVLNEPVGTQDVTAFTVRDLRQVGAVEGSGYADVVLLVFQAGMPVKGHVAADPVRLRRHDRPA